MKQIRLAMPILACLLALAACGTDSGAESSAAASPTATETDAAGPNWPADCGEPVYQVFNVGRNVTGFATPEEAAAHAQDAGSYPGATYTVAPADEGPTRVWAINPETDEIWAEYTVRASGKSWSVSGVSTCR